MAHKSVIKMAMRPTDLMKVKYRTVFVNRHYISLIHLVFPIVIMPVDYKEAGYIADDVSVYTFSLHFGL